MIDAMILTAAIYTSGHGTLQEPKRPAVSAEPTATLRNSMEVNSGERPKARSFSPSQPTRSAWAMPVLRKASAVPQRYLSFARCVLDRESGGTLERIQSGAGARNPASSAQGRWQFLDHSWRPGLSHMVVERLEKFGLPKADGKKVRAWLASHPIAEWHGYYQDTGFVAVVLAGGRHHWNGGSHSC